MGGHASINSIGKAYTILRKHIPRERIIVIAQLQECVKWHDQDVSEKVKGIEDPKRIELQKVMWQERKDAFMQAVGTLLMEGGADYDGHKCNPDCILRVLLGEKSADYPRVVEYDRDCDGDDDGNPCPKTKVFLSMFGHGNWNAKMDNHYFFMPYPVQSVLDCLMQTERPPPSLPPPPEVPPGALLDVSPADMEQVAANDAAALTETTGGLEVAVADRQPSEAQPESPQMTPVRCSGIDEGDPLYRCINSYLPLRPPASTLPSSTADSSEDGLDLDLGLGHLDTIRRPFRVHLSHSPTDGKKAPKTDAQMNKEDASVLHWQYLFEVLRRLFGEGTDDGGSDGKTESCPKVHKLQLFIFQQSCGSGGMWLWLSDPLYEKTYRCSEWPLFVAYTAEPETNAVGASWQVFYSCLERALGASTGSSSYSNSAAMYGGQNNSVEIDSRDSSKSCKRRRRGGEEEEDALVASLSLGTGTTTLSSFYVAVSHKYYHIEPTIYRINFDLDDAQRKAMFCAKFGVLGTAYGRHSGMDQMCIRSFFCVK